MTIAFWRVSPTVSHRVQKRGLKSHSPATWDDAVKHSAALMSHMARPSQHANEGRIPETLLRGDTDDVSACVESGRRWPVWSWRPEALSPDHRVLARWLGPSSDIGVALTCGLATKEASPIGRSTAQPVTGEESREPGVTGGGAKLWTTRPRASQTAMRSQNMKTQDTKTTKVSNITTLSQHTDLTRTRDSPLPRSRGPTTSTGGARSPPVSPSQCDVLTRSESQGQGPSYGQLSYATKAGRVEKRIVYCVVGDWVNDERPSRRPWALSASRLGVRHAMCDWSVDRQMKDMQ